MEKLHLTRDALAKLKDDLAAAKSRSSELAAEIEKARGFGDLRENAEYHAAKDAQGKNQAHIRNLEDKLARSTVIDESQIDSSKAYMGATVRLLNKKTQKEVTYTLVSPVEADMASGRISMKSPVGRALAGKSVGEVAEAKVPAGTIAFEILEISRG